MSLMKQICEEVNSYKAFLGTIVDKIEQFQDEISTEKCLGLTLEASDYYQNGNQQEPNAQSQQGMSARIQLMYNPETGKVEQAVKAHGSNPPSPDYIQPSTQQLEEVIKRIDSMDKRLADKIVSGEVSVWVPKNSQTAPQSNTQQSSMDPSHLANAQATASQMSVV